MKRFFGAVVAFLFLLSGCSASSSQNSSQGVPDGWKTDSVSDLLEFAYPGDLEATDAIADWETVYGSSDLKRAVGGNYSPNMPQDPNFVSIRFFVPLTMEVGVENMTREDPETITIDGHEAVRRRFSVGNPEAGIIARGCLWSVRVDDSKLVSVFAYFKTDSKADLDKPDPELDQVEKSIKVID